MAHLSPELAHLSPELAPLSLEWAHLSPQLAHMSPKYPFISLSEKVLFEMVGDELGTSNLFCGYPQLLKGVRAYLEEVICAQFHGF